MPKIIERQLVDFLSRLEDVTKLEHGDVETDHPEDLFLCALGFEERCLTLPEYYSKLGYQAKRACYFRYRTNPDDNSVNLTALERYLRGISSAIDALEVDDREFSNRLRAMLELVVGESHGPPPRVTFDISVAANRVILRCIKVLLEFDVSVQVIYSEAEIYHPTKIKYDVERRKWESDELVGLEQGVSEVSPSFDYPGNALDQLPDSIVLLPNFNGRRSKAVVSFVDPALLTNPGSKVAWILGIPHLKEDHWRLDAVKRINGISDEAPILEVSTFDYRKTLMALDRLWGQLWESHNITLSPLGSKMQALGVAIFCYLRPDVRIIFSVPQNYNAVQYSQGCKDIWKVNLGMTNDLRLGLDEVGKLSVVD